MKALIIKRGNTRGKYYEGRTIKEIVRNFIKSKPNLSFIMLEDYRNRYDIHTVDTNNRKWVFYSMPKNKIIK